VKTLRRIIFTLALLTIAVCGGLLVTNFDPTNPTHRRYSSELVLSTGEAPSDRIGADGERVLGKDLRIIHNEAMIPVSVFCNPRYENTDPPTKNTECVYFSDTIENYRIPDFLTDGYIAESKNSAKLAISYERDYKQIQAFATASAELNRPFYIYVRHNTIVDPEFDALFENIDGGIVYYFATDDYVNPTDLHLLLGIIGGLSIIVIWIGISKIVTFIMPTPKSSVVVPEHKASRKARKAVDDYNDFMRNAGDSARKTLDD